MGTGNGGKWSDRDRRVPSGREKLLFLLRLFPVRIRLVHGINYPLTLASFSNCLSLSNSLSLFFSICFSTSLSSRFLCISSSIEATSDSSSELVVFNAENSCLSDDRTSSRRAVSCCGDKSWMAGMEKGQERMKREESEV